LRQRPLQVCSGRHVTGHARQEDPFQAGTAVSQASVCCETADKVGFGVVGIGVVGIGVVGIGVVVRLAAQGNEREEWAAGRMCQCSYFQSVAAGADV